MYWGLAWVLAHQQSCKLIFLVLLSVWGNHQCIAFHCSIKLCLKCLSGRSAVMWTYSTVPGWLSRCISLCMVSNLHKFSHLTGWKTCLHSFKTFASKHDLLLNFFIKASFFVYHCTNLHKSETRYEITIPKVCPLQVSPSLWSQLVQVWWAQATPTLVMLTTLTTLLACPPTKVTACKPLFGITHQ